MGLLDKIKPQVIQPRPASLNLDHDGTLRIRWDDGDTSALPPHWLRARCPCAGCVEEWSGKRTFGDDQVGLDVKPKGLLPVGCAHGAEKIGEGLNIDLCPGAVETQVLAVGDHNVRQTA